MAIYNFELMERARQDMKMEWNELAYRVGLSEAHIRQILSGAVGCSEKTMWKIAAILELSAKKLEKQQHKR